MRTNTVNGILFEINNPQDVIQRKLVKGTQWNRWCFELIIELQATHNLKHLVNAGSHIGTLALPLSRVFERVTCVEPYPPTYEHLLRNIQLNGFDNIHTRNYALGSEHDTVFFVDGVTNNTGGIHSVTASDIDSDRKGGGRAGKQYTRPMHPLDDTDIDLFDILLMDVEGTELELLEGAEHKIHKLKPIIITEIWDDAKRTLERLQTTRDQAIQRIESMGYTLIKNKKDDFLFMPK
jgi:FkbM family methyltransferase